MSNYQRDGGESESEKYNMWTKIGEKLHNIALVTVKGLSILLIGFLFFTGLFVSCQINDLGIVPAKNMDSVFLHLFWIGIMILLLGLLFTLSEKKLKVFRNIFLCVVLLNIIRFGRELIIQGESGPTADQYIVYRLAELFAINDFAAIQPTSGTYLSFYPHQLGIISIYEMIIRFWSRMNSEIPAYEVIKNLNIVGACGIVLIQCRIVQMFSKSVKAEIVYLLLMLLNLPLIFYTSFVYGEILSVLCFSGGLYLFIRYEQEGKGWLKLVFSLLLFVLSVVFRINAIIFNIAVACVMVVQGVKKRRGEYFVYILLLLIGSANILPTVRSIYEYRAGNTVLDGVPAIAYISMGMQEGISGNGFYNGYNYNTFEACNMDRALMTEVCIQDIKERVDYFVANKKEAISFYLEKIMYGWTDGTYSCRQAIASVFLYRQDILEKLCTGESGMKFSIFCNWYQTVIYFGSFLFLIKEWKSRSLIHYVCFIAAFGGFVFHLVWEMSPRYVMPYTLLLTINAAVGFKWLAGKITTFIRQVSIVEDGELL